MINWIKTSSAIQYIHSIPSFSTFIKLLTSDDHQYDDDVILQQEYDHWRAIRFHTTIENGCNGRIFDITVAKQ